LRAFAGDAAGRKLPGLVTRRWPKQTPLIVGTALRDLNAKEIFMTSKGNAELLSNRSDYPVAQARYPSMNNVRSWSAQDREASSVTPHARSRVGLQAGTNGRCDRNPASLSSAITHLEPSSKKR
jgi:hypothetical protein